METISSKLNVSPLRRGAEWLTLLRRCLRESGEIICLSDAETAALQTLVEELRFPVYAQLVRGIAVRFGTVCYQIHFDYAPSDSERDDLDVSVLRLGDWNVDRVDVDVQVSDAEYARYLCGDRIAATSCGRLRVTLVANSDDAPAGAEAPPVADEADPPTVGADLNDASDDDSPAQGDAGDQPSLEDEYVE